MRASPTRPSGDRDHGGDADEREVAVATRDLVERPARAVGTGRDPDLGQQFVVGHRGREVADEEVVGRHDPLALRERTTISAPVTTATAGSSADASACAIEPPMVPRLRIETWPMNGSASASTGARSATSGECSAVRSRVERADGDARCR